MTNETTPLLVSTKKAFQMIAVGKTKGFQLISDGELDAIRIGSATRITVSSIHDFIERGKLAYHEQPRRRGFVG